jgi:hypothetical protein
VIECPSCGHLVSREAAACPNCGHPIRKSAFRAIDAGLGALFGCLGSLLAVVVVIVVVVVLFSGC